MCAWCIQLHGSADHLPKLATGILGLGNRYPDRKHEEYFCRLIILLASEAAPVVDHQTIMSACQSLQQALLNRAVGTAGRRNIEYIVDR